MLRTHHAVVALFLVAPFVAAAPVPKAAKGNTIVIRTNQGDIEVELDADKAPVTVKNFLQHVDDKFYDGLVFHRVIPDFMIQGGGYEPGMKARAVGETIPCESDNGLSNVKGTLAMARAQKADSATTQFFINTKDNVQLDKAKFHDKVGYCVFGKVTAGMDVVEKIAGVKTGRAGIFNDVPTEDVVIESIRRK